MDGGEALGNPLSRVLPVATKNMGWKLGYIASLDGTRLKDGELPGAVGPTMAISVVEEIGDKPAAGVAKLSEYDGGWALSKGVGKVGSALDSGWYSKLISGGWDDFSEGAIKLRPLSPSVVLVPRRPLAFS